MGLASADPRLVVVGGYPPNEVFGGGLVLKQLLAQYPTDRLAVVTSAGVLENFRERSDGGGLLAVPHLAVQPWHTERSGLRRLVRAANLLKVSPATRLIAKLVDAETVLLALPWGGELGSELFAAAYFAHRFTGVPLVVYELDEWRASVSGAGLPARLLEALVHGPMLRSAKTVWVMSEPLARTLAERFGIAARVMPHSVDLDSFRRGSSTVEDREEFRLLYTGAVYRAQADAIARVAQAVEAVEFPCRLVLYTAESPASLAALGIAGQRVSIERPVRPQHVPALLAQADALLLPFSFDPAARDIVSTSLPTKTADYLAAGVPILVHAPSYATTSRLALEEGWGLAVSEASIGAVVKAIEALAGDAELRRRLVERASAVAAARHDLEQRRLEFCDSIRSARLAARCA
jgi:glycosyltransferase involved in cell wall biosynthesis